MTICPFKALTGIPCPGCGGLRALEMLLHGDVSGALYTNPLSVAVSLFLVASGFWIATDVVYRIRGKREGRERRARLTWLDFMHRPWPRLTAAIAIALLLANWVWNIYKGL